MSGALPRKNTSNASLASWRNNARFGRWSKASWYSAKPRTGKRRICFHRKRLRVAHPKVILMSCATGKTST